MSQDILTIAPLNSILVLSRQEFVDPSWLVKDDLVQVVEELKELSCEHIDLHHDSVGNFLGLLWGEHLLPSVT